MKCKKTCPHLLRIVTDGFRPNVFFRCSNWRFNVSKDNPPERCGQCKRGERPAETLEILAESKLRIFKESVSLEEEETPKKRIRNTHIDWKQADQLRRKGYSNHEIAIIVDAALSTVSGHYSKRRK